MKRWGHRRTPKAEARRDGAGGVAVEAATADADKAAGLVGQLPECLDRWAWIGRNGPDLTRKAIRQLAYWEWPICGSEVEPLLYVVGLEVGRR